MSVYGKDGSTGSYLLYLGRQLSVPLTLTLDSLAPAVLKAKQLLLPRTLTSLLPSFLPCLLLSASLHSDKDKLLHKINRMDSSLVFTLWVFPLSLVRSSVSVPQSCVAVPVLAPSVLLLDFSWIVGSSLFLSFGLLSRLFVILC